MGLCRRLRFFAAFVGNGLRLAARRVGSLVLAMLLTAAAPMPAARMADAPAAARPMAAAMIALAAMFHV